MFFSSSEGRKCSKCGVHKGICVYIYIYVYIHADLHRFAKVNGNVLSIWSVYVLSMQK